MKPLNRLARVVRASASSALNKSGPIEAILLEPGEDDDPLSSALNKSGPIEAAAAYWVVWGSFLSSALNKSGPIEASLQRETLRI